MKVKIFRYIDSSKPSESLGPSQTEIVRPLSSGLNIPVYRIKRSYSDYYTVCRYLPVGQKPDNGEYIEVDSKFQMLEYYSDIHKIQVESFPLPIISVDLPYRVIQDGDTFRVYPFVSNDVFVEFRRVVDGQTDTGFISHFDVELFGYDLKEATGFNVPLKIVAGDESADFNLILENPRISVSDRYVYLESSGEARNIEITSNLHWWFDYDK